MDHWTENYCDEEKNFFKKKKSYIASLFTFFEKVSAICEFSFLYECSNLCITLLTNNI